MVLLSKKKEVVVVHEVTAGTTPTNEILDNANAAILIEDAEPTFEIDFVPRDSLRDTITALKSIPGQKVGGVTARFELVGNADDTFASGVPPWSDLLEICGFRRVTLQQAKAVADQTTTSNEWIEGAGPIRHGEVITDGTATARLVGDYYPDDSQVKIMYIEPISGTMDPANTPWTTSDTEFDIDMQGSLLTDVGWAWVPVSEPLKQITLDAVLTGTITKGAVYQGGTSGAILVAAKDHAIGDGTLIYRPGSIAPSTGETLTRVSGTGQTTLTADSVDTEEAYYQWPTASVRLNEDGVACDFVGSRGNVQFEFEPNRPVICTVTTRGRWDSGDSGDDLDGVGDTPLIGGANVITPKLWAGRASDVALNEDVSTQDFQDEQTACFKSLSIDMGVTLADDKCAHSEDALREIIGTGRAATGSFEVNATFENDIPWLTTFRNGTVVRARIQVGGSTAITAHDGFVFYMPAIQYTGAASGDSDGILTRQMDISLNAAVMNNLGATADGEVSSTSGDNEMILFYVTEIT